MKHTDGPWEIWNGPYSMGNEIHGNIDGGYGDDGSQIRSTLICEVNDKCDNWKSNANLIAAAPDLLDALIELFSYAHHHVGPRIQEKVQQAINKAQHVTLQ